jgi:putative transposase
VVQILEELKQRRGLPRQVRRDNGPEFVSRAVDQWAYEQGSAVAHDPTRTTDGERLRGELRWTLSCRVPERELLTGSRPR